MRKLAQIVAGPKKLVAFGNGDRPARWLLGMEDLRLEAMTRLHGKGFISNPVGKAKSVVLTEEGEREAERSF